MFNPETQRSRSAIQWVNFFLADVRDGLGPFLAVFYLTTMHWSNVEVGFILTVTGLAGIVAQTPAGAFIDHTHYKRLTLVIVSVIISLTCILAVTFPHYPLVLSLKILMGASASFIAPAIAGITLGLVGPELFAKQVGKNEAYNHAGNVVASLLAGVIGYYLSFKAVFYLVSVMSLCSFISLIFINKKQINHKLARGFSEDQQEQVKVSFVHIFLSCPALMIFTLCVTLFHFSNAGMLPMLGQELAKSNLHAGSLFMSASIITAQVVMIMMAIMVGKKADQWGRKKIFLLGFLVLPIRGVLYTLWHNKFYLVSIQILDGIGAGIFGALFMIVIADLTEGTGRYNITQGAVLTIMGVGAAFSTTFAGFIADKTNYDTAFLSLAGIGLLAFLLFLFCMPETRHYRQQHLKKS